MKAKNETSVLQSVPKQARARDALDRILLHAVKIIAKDGVGGLSTEDLARRADVNIATLYKYFRNKDAVIKFLAQRMSEEQTGKLKACIESFEPNAKWQVVMLAMIQTMVRSWTDIPGFRQIQRYYVLDPELHEIYRASSRQVSKLLLRFRSAWSFKGSSQDWERVHVVFGECATALLDLALEAEKSEQKKIIKELERIALTYHAFYFKP